MVRNRGPLTWAQEAQLRAEALATRPDWMPSLEDIEATIAESRLVRVVVTGSSDWTDKRSIKGSLKRALKFIEAGPERAMLIHGGAQGADLLTAEAARELGMISESHPIKWNVHNDNCPREEPSNGGCWRGRDSCKRAAFRRNQEMIDTGADILIGFISDRSKEGLGMLETWLKEDRPAIICRQSGDGSIQGEFVNMDVWK